MDIINRNRGIIDIIDNKIVALLNDRYYFCEQIGEEKKRLGMESVYVPEREQQIISNLSEKEDYTGMVEAIWPSIMSFSRELQKK